MKDRTDLINYIATKIKATSYLELGVQNPWQNFNKISVRHKIGVDPDPKAKATRCMTSDEYFKSKQTVNVRYDLAFIDGLHYAYQVKRDIINCWNFLNHGGAIILHDSNPPTVETTCIPRGSQKEWCGDTYRAICNIVSEKFTVDLDYGLCVLRKTEKELIFSDEEISWGEFDLFRKEALNLVSVEEAIKIIDSW